MRAPVPVPRSRLLRPRPTASQVIRVESQGQARGVGPSWAAGTAFRTVGKFAEWEGTIGHTSPARERCGVCGVLVIQSRTLGDSSLFSSQGVGEVGEEKGAPPQGAWLDFRWEGGGGARGRGWEVGGEEVPPPLPPSPAPLNTAQPRGLLLLHPIPPRTSAPFCTAETCTGQDLADLGDRLRDWFQLLRENSKQNGSASGAANPAGGMGDQRSAWVGVGSRKQEGTQQTGVPLLVRSWAYEVSPQRASPGRREAGFSHDMMWAPELSLSRG